MKLPEPLWHAAVAVRDRLGPAEARDLVLGLLALRLLSTRPGAPPPARWEALDDHASLRGAREAWIALDPELDSLLPDLAEIEPRRLRAVLRAISDLSPTEKTDPLGEVYTHLLGAFARAEGHRGGQYYTPPDVAALLAELIAPVQGSIYDPACGSGGLLLHAARQASAPVRLYGQEINPATWRLARLGCWVSGLDLDLGPHAADSLTQDLHPGLGAMHVLANPPFNLSSWGAASTRADPRWRYGLPSDKNANLAWIQHALHHLHPDGTGAVLLANSALTARSRKRTELRCALLQSGRIQALIALPDRLFWTTNIPACVWVLGRTRPTGVLMIDARFLVDGPTSSHRSLPPEARARLSALVHRYRAGEEIAVSGLARTCPVEQLVQGEARLSPGAFVGLAAPTPTSTSSLADLRSALRKIARERRRLDEDLDRALTDLLGEGE